MGRREEDFMSTSGTCAARAASVIVVIVASTALPPPAAFGREYSVTRLPVDDMPGVGAFDINDAGVVVGIREDNSQPGRRWSGFVWGPTTGMIDLGEGPGALAINNQGTVVGRWDGLRTGNHAFLWTAAGGARLLSALPGGWPFAEARSSDARGVNDAGQIIGYFDGSAGLRAYVREPGGDVRWLPTPAAPEYGGLLVFDINDRGDVVGAVRIEDVGYHAYLWPTSGGFVDLGDLPGGSVQGIATSVNNRGQILGSAVGPADPGVPGSIGQRAVLFATDGTIRDLGTLPGMGGSSPADINELGEVVGWSGIGSVEDWRAFLWTEQEGMRDLHDLLDASGRGWELQMPSAINNVGQILVHGEFQGRDAIAILTPVPEPTGTTAALLAAATFGLRRRRT